MLSVALRRCSAVAAAAAGSRDVRWRWEKQAPGLSPSEPTASTASGTGTGKQTCGTHVLRSARTGPTVALHRPTTAATRSRAAAAMVEACRPAAGCSSPGTEPNRRTRHVYNDGTDDPPRGSRRPVVDFCGGLDRGLLIRKNWTGTGNSFRASPRARPLSQAPVRDHRSEMGTTGQTCSAAHRVLPLRLPAGGATSGHDLGLLLRTV